MLRIILVMAACAGIATAGSSKALDDKYGFRDLKFESAPDTAKGFLLNEKDGDTEYYTRRGDQMTIGSANLKFIGYVFYKGKLSSVRIDASGFANSKTLLEVLSQSYGDPEQPNELIQEYYWFGDKVHMLYEYSEVHEKSSVAMFCRKIIQEKAADDKKRAKAAASDL